MLVPFARQSKEGNYSGERLLNLFLRQSDATSPGVLMGRGCAVEVADLQSPVRAVVDNGGSLFALARRNLWEIVDGSPVSRGEVPDCDEMHMAASGTQVAIVAGGRYYLWDGTTLAEYSTGAVDTPKGVAYVDGYFIVIGESAGRLDAHTISALDDGKTFDASDFAFAESSTDAVVAVIEDHSEILFFGSKTVETWYNAGGSGYPLSPNKGARVDRGCAIGRSVAKGDSGVFWVGPDNKVFRRDGANPRIISTREIGEVLADNTVTGGFTFNDRDHEFYCITLRGRPSLCYDMTTGLWSERSTGLGEKPWFCTCRATVNGTEYFGTSTGKIVTLSPSAFNDTGTVVVAEAISVPVDNAGEYFSVSKAHIDIRGGVGDIGRTPQVMVQTSRDGKNWSVEKWRNIGDEGEFGARAVWHGLGAFRRFQMRLRITDEVPRDVYGVRLHVN